MNKKKIGRGAQRSPLGKLLTVLMAEKGLGVREAAKLAGVSSSTIVDWRSGVSPNDYLAVRKLATALGVSLGFLLTGEDDSRPAGSVPAIAEVFADGGMIFDGFARIRIERLVPHQLTKGESK